MNRPDLNKAISIKQPWAYLICAGIKDVENRTWATKYRGRVYIHTSAKLAKHEFTWEQSSELTKHEELDIVYSAIIGHVDIVVCVINHDSIWAEKSETGLLDEPTNEYGKPIYNWILANPVLFDKPILNVKGKLSFWSCSEYLKGIEL